MRSLARWGALPLIGMPLSTWALTLGEIELNSYLNQPLNAEIGLSATAEELNTLSVSLAEPARFLAAGLDYPAFLTGLNFRVTRNEAGDSVILVNSRQAVADPFVTIIVTASHARGSLSKEYTMLLDPPMFLPDEVAAEPIAAPVTRPEPAAAGGAIAREPARAAAPAPAPAPRAVQPAEPIAEPVAAPQAEPEAPAARAEEPAAEAAPAPLPARAATAAGSSYTVAGGDTLWGITNQVRPAGVSMNQAMLAIFEANPGAFDGNINRLRRGAILRIPPATQLNTMAAADATAEVQRQIDIWRGAVASTPQLVLRPPEEEPAPLGLTIGGDASADEPEAAEPESLAADAGQAAADAETPAERLIEVTSNALADLQQLGDSLETDAADGAESDALFVDEVDGGAVAAAETAEEPAAAEPEPAVSARNAPVVSQTQSPSVIDQIIGWITQPIFAIGAGVVVVLLAALAFLRRRRDAVEDVTGEWQALEAEIDEEADTAATARLRAQADADMLVVEGHDATDTVQEEALSGTGIFEAPDLDDRDLPTFDPGTTQIEQLSDFRAEDDDDLSFQGDQTISSQTVIDLDQADPIAEADFHMAYGLYDQAADLITKALESEPDSRELKLKLLEVYFVWGNKDQFLASATALRDELGADRNPDWDKVVIMGKQICSDEPLFADATAVAGEIDLDLDAGGAGVGVDFALGEESDDADDGLEFDLDMAIEDSELSLATSEVEQVGTPADDDLLDIGDATQAGLEAALFEEIDSDGAMTQPGDHIDDIEEALESPTMETAMPDFSDSPTVENPTLGSPALDEGAIEDTVEPAKLAAFGDGTAEMTAELEIDDLGLDLGDLGDLPADISDLPDSDGGDLLAATGSTQVLDPRKFEDLGDDSAESILEADFEGDGGIISTEVLEQPVAGLEPEPVQTESDLDLNLDDFSTALGDDTVEQPFGSDAGGLDLDVGMDLISDDEPTGTEAMSSAEPQTMTEVGTKLDLARAYIDMGDPDGAKSILEEVLSEGDSGQRDEAQALIRALPG